MHYYFIVEENFGIRPQGEYRRYPGKEFKIAYTHEAKASVAILVQEILRKKASGKEIHCSHKKHYI